MRRSKCGADSPRDREADVADEMNEKGQIALVCTILTGTALTLLPMDKTLGFTLYRTRLWLSGCSAIPINLAKEVWRLSPWPNSYLILIA